MFFDNVFLTIRFVKHCSFTR